MIGIFVNVLIIFIALLHFWFFILETFLWQKPYGMKVFKLNAEFAKQSATLAANQGLYNLFLSAGLLWSLFTLDLTQALHLKIFFLSCVLIAGVYGGITASFRILIIQGLPALVVLGLLGLEHVLF